MSRLTLSVIIPVYNEEATVASVIETVRAAERVTQIVVVDDASSDATAEKIETVAGDDLVFVAHERNQGKGAAIRTALPHCTEDLVIIQDADLEYTPDDYPRLLEPLDAGRADVVVGTRFQGGGAHRVLFFWHYIANKFLTLLSNAMTNLNLTDMEVGYKVFRREVIQPMQLRSNRFGFEPEVVAKIARGGWRLYEVPIAYYGRDYSEGKKITWKDGITALYCIFRFSLFD